jgi:competence protein ComEA
MEYIKNNKGIVILVIGLLALIIFNYNDNSTTQETIATEYSEKLVTTINNVVIEEENYIMVDIKGEVNYPGLYQVSDNMRLGDVIGISGGVTEAADLSNINLAIKLVDEMIITIPAKEEIIIVPTDIVKIKVEIKGEVKNPNVYIIYNNSRISDLIKVAGGLTEDADTSNTQLAKILIDGETIIIPKLIIEETVTDIIEEREIYVEINGEVINPGIYLVPENYSIQDLIYKAGGVTVNCDLEMINWDLKICLGASIYIPAYGDEEVEDISQSDKININTANLEELSTLTGIGQILGQRVIDYRAEFGDFLCIEDIMYVSGIKTSIYEEIKESITV